MKCNSCGASSFKEYKCLYCSTLHEDYIQHLNSTFPIYQNRYLKSLEKELNYGFITREEALTKLQCDLGNLEDV